MIDDIKSIYQLNHGKFVFQLDLARIVRYARGQIKKEPPFQYYRCQKLSEVQAHCEAAKKATLIAEDIETITGFISSISFTYDKDGFLITFCVPFFDPWNEDGCYWRSHDEEVAVRLALADLNDCEVPKGMQNGVYDCAYLILEGMIPKNYFYDSQSLMHSIWVEAPKALHNISSYFIDRYVYWKDDAKGIQEDGYGKTREDIEIYWRYNGLDTYYTYLDIIELVNRIILFPWAVRNYSSEFSLSVGPCLAASMRGIKFDFNRHSQIMAKQIKLAEEGANDLIRMTGEEQFNVKSPDDVAWMLYDILGARPTRLQRKNSKYGPRSTDEKVLKLVKEQGNVLINNFIDRLLAAREPKTLLSQWGNTSKLVWADKRFHSLHNAAATETGRFNSGSWQLWTGRNAQNMQPFLREIMVADGDYFFLDVDWRASDDRFIGYESQDQDKIAQVEGGQDTHCYHASIFFSISYDKIRAGWKANEPWVVDSTEGVRQITKHVTHGRNFRMEAATLYNNMGRDAVISTAIALGHSNAAAYSDKELIGICQILIDKYDHPRHGLYKRIRPWQNEITEEAVKRGNLATCAFGMTRNFFGNLETDSGKQRELSAFYGQGGTAGNANRSLNQIFYSGIDDGNRIIFLLQGHDSFLILMHKSQLHRVPEIQRIMEAEFKIHERKLRIPTSAQVGMTWSKDMLDWTPELTYQDILNFEERTFSKKFPKNDQSMLETLAGLQFGTDALETLDAQLAQFGEREIEAQSDDEPELVSDQLE